MFEYAFIYLTLCPLAVALACLVLPGNTLRIALVSPAGIGLIVASAITALTAPENFVPGFLAGAAFTSITQIAVFCLPGLILFLGVKTGNRAITGLSLAQMALLGYFEFIMRDTHAPAGFYCDSLSLSMVLLISVAGSLVVLYTLTRHQRRHLRPARSGQLFALIFLSIGAMNGLVLVNDLMLFYLCFEITILCSFLLHDGTEAANRSAITTLSINTLGGAALLAGTVMLYSRLHTLEIQTILAAAPYGKAILIPLGLLCIAGFSQTAQLALLSRQPGITAAPTPVPGLVQASIMVMTGVYLVIRFAPPLEGTVLGTTAAALGAVSLLPAALAINRHSGKGKLSRVAH